MSNVATTNSSLPAHLQAGKKAKLGNLDATDQIMPRVKLLQAISPEVETHNAAKPGNFWHTTADVSMGETLRFVPLIIRRSYVLWAPRGDERGILARANDGIHWDKQDTFEVKPKGSAKKVKWTTSDTVTNSKLDKFGSSIPEDPDSPPAATLQYNILAYFLDHPDLSPAIMLNTRSGVKKAKALISKLEMRPVDHYGQQFVMSVVKESSAQGDFFNINYSADGYVENEGDFNYLKSLYERFSEINFRASDETDEAESGGKEPDVKGRF
jgi:hypothetical protein